MGVGGSPGFGGLWGGGTSGSVGESRLMTSAARAKTVLRRRAAQVRRLWNTL